MKSGFRLSLNILTGICTLLAFGSSFISTETLWLAGFLSMSIPVFMLLNLLWIIYWLFTRPMNALVSVAVLAIGYKFIMATFALNLDYPKAEADFKVLSYNVRVFNTYYHLSDKNHTSSKRMLEFVKEFPADVLCLQEFYDDKNSKVFNSISKIKKAGFKYHYFSVPDQDNKKSRKNRFGMAIFSKYPIVGKGEVDILSSYNNQITYSDVKLPGGIVRFYNIHLQSMSINEKELVTADTKEEMQRNIKSVFKKLRSGFLLRSKQVQELEKNIAECPYPVIVCGDLNDLPYSNTYYRLNNNLQNAFEEAGNGFGISYGGKLPFLRIDNQFVSKSLEVKSYNTHYDITYSDHYPISASYSFSEK